MYFIKSYIIAIIEKKVLKICFVKMKWEDLLVHEPGNWLVVLWETKVFSLWPEDFHIWTWQRLWMIPTSTGM